MQERRWRVRGQRNDADRDVFRTRIARLLYKARASGRSRLSVVEDVQRATAHAALIDLMVSRLDGLRRQVWFYVDEPGEHWSSQIFQSIAQLEGALQSMRADYVAPGVTEGRQAMEGESAPRPDSEGGEPVVL